MKFAIVSSYSESCGNASFTKIIHDSIEEYYPEVSVDVIELNLTLLQSINYSTRKKGDSHIKEIAEKLKSYDMVNIQMEAGLYGSLPSDILKRFKILLNSNKNVTVTLHSPRLIYSSALARSGIKKILRLQLKSGLIDLLGNKEANIHIKLNSSIIAAAIKKNAHLITHTKRAKIQISTLFGYSNVSTHPLIMVPSKYNQNKSLFKDIKNSFSVNEKDICIGLFGYISKYKGHHLALQALTQLPYNYKLFFFGRQHPQTIKQNIQIDAYLEELINTIYSQKLKNRVFFVGELNDDDFLSVVEDVDVSWLPYVENGQDGSGIASITFEKSKAVICSSSFAFDELFKLMNYTNYERFDIGNYIELAQKTKLLLEKNKSNSDSNSVPNPFNLKTQAKVYLQTVATQE